MVDAVVHAGGARSSMSAWPVVVATMFVLVHLALEHVGGGVRSHHLLADPGLPEISNWLGLLTLPSLGLAFAWRARRHAGGRRLTGLPVPMLLAAAGACLYGAAMATAFHLGAAPVTKGMFLGLFLVGLLLPVYRVEYIAGFVLGMTMTFGGVLPLLVGSVVAIVSFVVRGVGGFVIRKVRG